MVKSSRALVVGLVVSGSIALACSQAEAPGSDSQKPAPGAAPAAAESAQPAGTKESASSPAPTTVADLFPPGAGRDPVLNNCGSCHNLACSTIGQRTNARWDSLKESHRDNVPGADLDVVFAYLKANFNDSKPEPKVPPKFLEGGCTPF